MTERIDVPPSDGSAMEELDALDKYRENAKNLMYGVEGEADPLSFINADREAQNNLFSTIHYVFSVPHDVLLEDIKVEKQWKQEGAFDERVKAWNDSNPSSFKGGFIASVESLRTAISDGTISKDAPWFNLLKERMHELSILLLG